MLKKCLIQHLCPLKPVCSISLVFNPISVSVVSDPEEVEEGQDVRSKDGPILASKEVGGA